MPNREFGTDAEFSPSLSRQEECRECEEQSVLSRQPDPLAQVTCRAGDDSCARAHASALNRATDTQPSRSGQSLAQLQRQYGNRYVQRVLDLARKGEDEAEVSPDVEQAIQQTRDGGQPLDSGTRVQMESAFGADFSGVRVHADAGSDALSRSLNARAFTTGQDVFFRQGTYDPGSSSGRELLAHELTHVVQQNGDEVQRKLTVNAPGDLYEQEADQVAREIVQQQAEEEEEEILMPQVQRQAEEEEEEILMPQVQRQVEEDDEEGMIQSKTAAALPDLQRDMYCYYPPGSAQSMRMSAAWTHWVNVRLLNLEEMVQNNNWRDAYIYCERIAGSVFDTVHCLTRYAPESSRRDEALGLIRDNLVPNLSRAQQQMWMRREGERVSQTRDELLDFIRAIHQVAVSVGTLLYVIGPD